MILVLSRNRLRLIAAARAIALSDVDPAIGCASLLGSIINNVASDIKNGCF
jgi:hypothetical protein